MLFSSHQLDLVQDICEAVAIIHRGRLVAQGRLAELRRGGEPRLAVRVAGDPEGRWAGARPAGTGVVGVRPAPCPWRSHPARTRAGHDPGGDPAPPRVHDRDVALRSGGEHHRDTVGGRHGERHTRARRDEAVACFQHVRSILEPGPGTRFVHARDPRAVHETGNRERARAETTGDPVTVLANLLRGVPDREGRVERIEGGGARAARTLREPGDDAERLEVGGDERERPSPEGSALERHRVPEPRIIALPSIAG